MKNVLFLGRFYPTKILENISKDTGGRVGFSNHNFEMSLIRGFAAQEGVTLRALTAPLVFSYPHNNRRAIIKSESYEENGVYFRSIGFNNIVGLNIFSTIINLTKAIIEELNAFKGENITIVVNTPSLVLSTALFRAIKKSSKRVTTILIVPDVPECMLEMNGRLSLKGHVLKQINKYTARLSKKYDKYVFLTEAMKDFYHARREDYIVMEGLIDEDKNKDMPTLLSSEGNREIILYTGTLRKIFGVMDLIEVFERGKFPNTELWICGSGECADEIGRIAEISPSIKFFGLVDSARARELQAQATILVNPRSAKGNYTRYSFPSKTIEYMIAGKIVIMNRLPGVPIEYDKYLNYPHTESVDSWVSKINEILQQDPNQRQRNAKKARDFIIFNKNTKVQCKRILSLCK